MGIKNQVDLSNQVAFVTGAAQGIGKGVSLTLARYGADIVATDIKTEGIKQTIKEVEILGRKGLAITMNVSDSIQVNEGVENAIKKFGKIDILVNCAGIVNASMIVDLEEKIWDKVMDVNAKGVFLCCKRVAKEMIKNKRGKIINVSSQSAKLGEIANGVYCCSKAAVSMLTQVLGLELAPYNINVNAVCPGPTDTEIMQNVFRERAPLEGMTPEEYEKAWYKNVPLNRMAKPEEIGEFIAFLASDKSEYITGVSLTIAGGMTTI